MLIWAWKKNIFFKKRHASGFLHAYVGVSFSVLSYFEEDLHMATSENVFTKQKS